MNYKEIVLENDEKIVIVESDEILLKDEQSALDFLMTAAYETGSRKIIISKDNLPEEFFDLKTKIAGAVLQKIVNYGFTIAVCGDYSAYKSGSLKDFIYESNNGRDIFFLEDSDKAVEILRKIL